MNGSNFSYDAVAIKYGATYFSLDDWDHTFNVVGKDSIWEINKAFLVQQENAGKTFLLSHDPYNATGYYKMEVEHLQNLGYSFIKQNDGLWKAVR